MHLLFLDHVPVNQKGSTNHQSEQSLPGSKEILHFCLFRLINTFNRESQRVVHVKNGGSLWSKANFALTGGLLTLPIHRYMIKEK